MRLPPYLNVVALTAAQVVASAATLVTLIVLGRSLPTAELALYLYMLAVVNAAEPLSDLGLRFSSVMQLAERRERSDVRGIVTACWILKAALSVLVLLAIAVLSVTGMLKLEGSRDVLLVFATAVTLPSANPLIWRLRAQGLQWVESLGLVAYKLAILGALLGLNLAAVTAHAAIVVVLAANVALYVFCATALVMAGSDRPMPSRRGPLRPVLASLVTRGAFLGGSLLLTQLATRIWVLVLGYFGFTDAVVAFGISQSLILTALLFGVALGNVYLPVLSALLGRNDKSAHALLARKLLVIAATLGAGLGIALYVCADVLVALMVSAPPDGAARTLRIMTFATAAILISFTTRFVLASTGQGRLELHVALAALLAALLLGIPTAAVFGGLGLAVLYCAIEYGAAAAKLIGAAVDDSFAVRVIKSVGVRVALAIPCALVVAEIAAGASSVAVLVLAAAAGALFMALAAGRDLRWFVSRDV